MLDSWAFTWVLLPLLIFFARICDVSLSTIRIIFITRGMKYIAPFIGFVEVSIWLLAIRQVMVHIENPLCFLAYGLGFAAGTFTGLIIAERLSVGKVILRVITRHEARKLVNNLIAEGIHVTSMDAKGAHGPVKIIFMVINGKQLRHIVSMVKKLNPNAFYSVEDVRHVSDDPTAHHHATLFPFPFMRKGK